jgi:hypothetical protein
MNFLDDLKTGDILLYHGTSLFNRITDLKTGGLADHVEVYVGHGLTVAARPEGFNYYDFRVAGLLKVRRPVPRFDLIFAEAWMQPLRGLEYDSPGLLQFFNVNTSNNGFVCSTGAAYFLRMGHVRLFADDYPLVKVSPRDFELVREAETIWKRPDLIP